MLNKATELGAVAFMIAASFSGATMEPSTPEGTWLTHADPEAGIEISYPANWQLIIAEQRLGSGAVWSPLILNEDELFKVVFRQTGDVTWPGWYEVRVLANPDSLTLDAYWTDFDLSDLWDASVADGSLAGRPAKTWVRWRYDSLVREHLTVTANRAIHVLYDEHNSNDPAFETHREIYQHMTANLRVLPIAQPGTPISNQ